MARTDETELMTAAQLKPLLRLSRRRPVSCAICLTKEGGGVLLLDRRMKPRRVLAQIRKDAKDSGMALNLPLLRFGRAAVDGGSDSMRVVFTVNKPAPGAMRMALLKQLRPAGYQRCEIVVDEGLETEPEDGEDEEDDDDDEPEDGEGSPAPVRDEPAAAETASLRRTLTGLVKEIVPAVAQAPDRKEELVHLATEGQQSLKHGDIAAAAHSISDLASALHDGVGGPARK